MAGLRLEKQDGTLNKSAYEKLGTYWSTQDHANRAEKQLADDLAVQLHGLGAKGKDDEPVDDTNNGRSNGKIGIKICKDKIKDHPGQNKKQVHVTVSNADIGDLSYLNAYLDLLGAAKTVSNRRMLMGMLCITRCR